ncbi:hypothetical protein HETIRDRAFT_414518 [Heterobasidion irregulare TC 32-1]|uniref:MIT domain-containing protein n=1 Tax=Heterobasidion irregulare (strain TC 32-1) TaxID=747525 RepID=W4KI17_HETIT|nr:uncharacterized protein HETIRDRAFT_414518 [Heterobasidion irregulare TC 32-1]ETW85503.1 hypothetical protein HETIRDRAFT_414518 [Heterobasidion irregulare TC 32-1]
MSTISSPLTTAHQHASNADDFIAQGLLVSAAEEHEKAAEAFQTCIDSSHDENAKRTLRMLFSEHIKIAKDLNRRIEKLKQDGVDPSLPQKPAAPRPAPVPTYFASRPSSSPPPTNIRGRMSDSQHTVDESFMLLGQQSTDAGDAFNTFWKAMEVLDHLSQPVAFATASLGLPESSRRALGREGSNSSDTDYEDVGRSRRARASGQSRVLSPDNSFATAYDGEISRDTTKSTRIKQSVIDPRNDFDEIVDEDYDSSDSFCMIPSKSEASPSMLKKEIVSLKSDLEATQKQLEVVERQLEIRKEQDQQLRDNIVVARREAQRAMGASLVVQRQGQSSFDIGSLNLGLVPPPPPMPPINPGRDRELMRRIKELEEELRTVRVESEKQKAMIAKFRERWDKLKESAKRKREARAAAAGVQSAIVHERIDEEPEAEAEAEQEQ